jgi:hypothetical protein
LPEVRSATFVEKAGNIFTLKIINNENFFWRQGETKKKYLITEVVWPCSSCQCH